MDFVAGHGAKPNIAGGCYVPAILTLMGAAGIILAIVLSVGLLWTGFAGRFLVPEVAASPTSAASGGGERPFGRRAERLGSGVEGRRNRFADNGTVPGET
jgi:hypothetical protein